MTLRRSRFGLLAVVCLLSATAITGAQAQTNTSSDVLYALTSAAGYEAGCFDPCLCIAHFTDGLAGTWRLRPLPPEPSGYSVYAIDQVNWFLPQLDQRITGSGTYRIGGEFARMHQLALDLAIDDGPVQHFDSGLVLGGAGFPAIDITLSMNNMVCTDTVFHVVAGPVDAPKLTPYGLFGSEYLEGCFGPCDCLVTSKPLLGRFGLMKLRSDNLGTDYAVLDIRWLVRDSNATAMSGIPVTGYGIYRYRPGGGVTTVMPSHRMTLSLSENGGADVSFDSGIVPAGAPGSGGGPPKRIDIDLADNGFACTDRVYSLNARRSNAARMDFGVISTDPVEIPVIPVP